ncbi:hypothetical protein K431DRAFT_307973 [Polychaeton citri CBS 116435]|uniref:Uncharacterized protein n=1 Tax=Polychaeton citri CBS 116435 TaxID=1314669 RepID=A0A9P4PWH4_9PEZI|nr:hypothetical protein K431DRAFT_307973 [Polychaeton citri CBS 116435]
MSGFMEELQAIPIDRRRSILRELDEGDHRSVYHGLWNARLLIASGFSKEQRYDNEPGRQVALKLERVSLVSSILEEEAGIYKTLKEAASDYPKPSLEDLLAYYGGTFTPETPLMLIDELLH